LLGEGVDGNGQVELQDAATEDEEQEEEEEAEDEI